MLSVGVFALTSSHLISCVAQYDSPFVLPANRRNEVPSSCPLHSLAATYRCLPLFVQVWIALSSENPWVRACLEAVQQQQQQQQQQEL